MQMYGGTRKECREIVTKSTLFEIRGRFHAVSPHFSIPNILSPEYKEPFLSKNVLKEEQPKA